MIREIMVGADVEVFVKDIGTGEIESSIGIVPGTKNKPYKTRNGYVHKDNVLAEFNMEPSYVRGEFRKNIQRVLLDLDKILLKKGKTYEVIASHEMKNEYLQHHLSRRFGCDPDFNVWELHSPPRIINSGLAGNLRTAGGHVHIGFPDEINISEQIRVVKSCEINIGLPSVILDKDTRRKKLYGSSGVFRHKPYGIEYRVPSNFWISSTDLMNCIFIGARQAYMRRWEIDTISEEDTKEIQHTINKNDVGNAKILCKKYDVYLPDSLIG